MVKLGNLLFRYRNGIFPFAYLFIFAKTRLLFADYQTAALVGLAIALAGQSLRVATIGLDYIVRGGRNRQVYAEDLVTGGLFSHCRNPLYVGNYLMLVGVGVASCSAIFIFVVLPLMAIAYWAIIAAEENFLRNKFGAVFDAYSAKVSRLWFSPVGLGTTLNGMSFHWPRVIVKEYSTTACWIGGYLLVVLQNLYLTDHLYSSPTLTVCLWSAFALTFLLFLLARFLKKRRILRG